MSSCSHHRIRFSKPLKGVSISYWGDAPIPLNEAQASVDDAYHRGRDEVTEFYESQLADQRQEIIAYQNNTLDQMLRQVQQFVSEAQDRIPSIVFALVERILGGVKLDQEQVAQLVENIIDEFSHHEGEELEIRLNIEDHKKFKEYCAEGSEISLKHISVEPDKNLLPMDVMVRSRFGLLDARLVTKLNKLKNEIDVE